MRRFFIAALLGALLVTTPGAAHPEYVPDNTALVDGWYVRYLGRNAELGASGWVNTLNAGNSPASVLAGIVGSDEYYQRAGNTPAGFVATAFRAMTGRSPTLGEQRFWVDRLYRSNATDVAYEMLLRYPHGLDAVAPRPAAPPVYEYRRPLERHRDWDHRDRERRDRP